MNAREQILHRLKSACETVSDLPEKNAVLREQLDRAWDDALPEESKMLSGVFVQALETVSGEYYGAAGPEEAAEIAARILSSSGEAAVAVAGGALVEKIRTSLPETLEQVDMEGRVDRETAMGTVRAALVEAQWGVAETGSLAFPYVHTFSTKPHFLTEMVIAVLKKDRLLPHLKALFGTLSPEEQKNLVLVTGPSRTADIEKVLILGAHGPKRVIVIMVD